VLNRHNHRQFSAVTSKRRKTNQTSNKQPKNGRQFLCNLTQTDLIFPTLKPTPMGLKIFPTAHFKNNFSQPHIGTFAKPHEPISASTLVVKIATFAKPENVISKPKRRPCNQQADFKTTRHLISKLTFGRQKLG